MIVSTTMANLRALTVSAITSADRIELLGHYAAGDGGGGEFIWNGADSRTDDGGAIIQPTAVSGSGRLVRIELSSRPVHSAWYGVIADDATDNKVALQAAIDTAFNYGVNEVVVDPTPNYINFSNTLNLHPGIIIRGHGANVTGNAAGISKLQCTYGSATTNPAFIYTTADGTDIIEAPKFYDLFLLADYGLQLNVYNGGYTDDGTTQNPLYNFIMERCNWQAINFYSTGGSALWLSKVQRGTIRDCLFQGYDYDIRLEGSDNFKIDNCYIAGAGTAHIYAIGHYPWGNALDIDHVIFEALNNGAWGCIKSSYNQLNVHDSYFEGPATVTSVIWLYSMTTARVCIRDNWIGYNSTDVTNWLKVDDTNDVSGGVGLQELMVTGNAGGSYSGGALFNSGAGITYYTGAGYVRRRIVHQGNGNELGFPCNTVATSQDSLPFMPNIVAYFSPNLDGLNAGGIGGTVKMAYGAFVFGATGSGNYLDFGNGDRTRPVGNLKLYVFASSASGSNIHGALTDAGVVVGSFVSQTLTAQPAWYTLSVQTVSTGGGCQFYADNADVHIYAAALGT